MKLAVATCCAIALCLGSLTVRALVLHTGAPVATTAVVPVASARAAPRAVDKRALAAIDQRLHRTLRKLARAAR